MEHLPDILQKSKYNRFISIDADNFAIDSFPSTNHVYMDPEIKKYSHIGMTQIEKSFAKCLAAQKHEKPLTTVYGVHRKKHVPKTRTESEIYEDLEEGPCFDSLIAGVKVDILDGSEEEIQPIQTYNECKFSKLVMANITRMGYKSPTPIQKGVFKSDIVAQAPTGSGKSASYLVPIINAIHRYKVLRREDINPNSPYAIILVPTRELVLQLYENACAFSNGTTVTPARCYGNYAVRENKDELLSGCDILLCTMGRLKAFVNKRTILLNKIQYFVMDEADALLMQGHSEFDEDMKILKDAMGTQHRMLLFSATYSAEALEKARKYIKTGYCFLKVGVMNTAVNSVTHNFLPVKKSGKIDYLFNLLKEDAVDVKTVDGKKKYKVPKTIVFVNKKKMADKIAIALSLRGIKAWSLTSDRPQQLREEALEALINDDDSNVLVCTDVMSRGHNIKKLNHVINFELPDTMINYIHRIGRTGRKGNRGRATSLFDMECENNLKLAEDIITMMESADQTPPDFLTELVEKMEKAFEATKDLY